jgi:curli biogenesis system outer membrane secretion channel CsgG
MTRRVVGMLVVGLIRIGVASGAMAQDALARPSVAIADVAITPGGWTLPPPELSATIVELMMNEMVASQRFHLYDGQWLVPESEAGGHVDLAALRAAAAERRLDYLVLGRLTAFTSERKKKGFGGAIPLPFIIGGFSRDQSLLKVGMTFRIVDVRSGEIVASIQGDGVGHRRSTAVGGLAIVHGVPLGAIAGAARAHSARDAMLDEAVRMAVHNAALELARRALPVASGPMTAGARIQ